MDELIERRTEEMRVRRPRIAALMARIDAGELDAIELLERRIRDDYGGLVREEKPELADAAWGWGLARIEDVERAGEYTEREDTGAEAPACWVGLRVRVTHLACAGLTRPVQVVGRLVRVTDRGLHVLTDELEEEGRRGSPEAGSIVRRVKAERLIGWPALLTVQPLPVREVYAIEANVRAHEAAATGSYGEATRRPG
ncbi:MAG: hypothetical protein M3P49_09280, partial [Actinomycetota bacterium]|nr:hypothetical protein [Actinomycetota bacterium]